MRPLRPRRLLAELQGEVSRSRRDVLPHDDGQPPLAGDARRGRGRRPVNAELVEQARAELYRGQCNCGYWHGAFGGIYLPHLRNAVYQHLIAADNLLDRAIGRPETWIEAAADDFNFDARQEVRLANDKLVALVAPSRGGQLYELDVRRIRHNLLATLARRPEAYHRKVLAGERPARRPGGQHPRPRGVQAARSRPAAAIRRPSPARA